jgi:predicted RNA-binding Zn ribbon-like protein
MVNVEPREHRHAATLGDTLDFLNTDELDGFGRPVEHLGSLAAATAWLEERGLLHPAHREALDATPAGRAATLLAHVLAVRRGLRDVVEALVTGRPADQASLAAVNRVLRARSVLELVPGEGALAIGHRHLGDPLDDALASVAEPLVNLVASGATASLRICANDGCRWVFEDVSRARRRRWCSMETCGNRAKVARHRARRRHPAAAEAPQPAYA